jgi:uncharacterized zinc-type alcohol dehydrogenase-like protein
VLVGNLALVKPVAIASRKEHLCVVHQEETIVGRHGGWADYVRAQARFTIPIPDNLDSAIAGPLMCAGTTVWTPMTHYGVRPGMKTAVLGVGGLGHIAVQFLAKFGTDVTAISSRVCFKTLGKMGNTRDAEFSFSG